MNRQDQISSLVWFIAGLLIIIGSLTLLEVGSFYDPGPGLFPLIAGVVLGILSLVILTKSTLSKGVKGRSLSELWAGLSWKKMLYAAGALFVYAFILDKVGFLLTTFLLIIFLFRAVEPQKWRIAVGASALISPLFYLLFDRLLKVQLPRGFMGF